MSAFEVRSFKDGVQDKVLYGASIEFTSEQSSEGYVKVSMARAQATKLGLEHRTEVAVFLDGEELDGSRSFLVETTGNPSGGEDAPGVSASADWGGQTMHVGLKSVITYPLVFPVVDKVVKNYKFKDKTPGFILKTLLDDARARGSAGLIETTTWDSLTDSNGANWDRTLTLEYKPGVDYKTVVDNMITLGAIEFRWVGRELKIFNAEAFGTDHAVGAEKICLYRGRDVSDSPYSESTAEVVNALLVMGDDGIMIEKTNAESIAKYGRREGSLSQGGTKDTGMLNYLGESTLETSSQMRGEYTVKVERSQHGAKPFTDYSVGDWVLYDRLEGQPPERFRVRQITISGDAEAQSVVVTLNDKFTELDLRTAKKVEGIIGGATMENSTPVDTPPDRVDPGPPSAVSTASEPYTDTTSGGTRVMAITSWVEPTENADGTPLEDLAGFDVEHRTSANVDYVAAESWYPLHNDARLQARWDRRGKDTVNNWVGADGGSSVRADNGEDWFFWSDTYWGTVDPDGKINLNSMPRSSITKSDPTTLNDLRGFASVQNLLAPLEDQMWVAARANVSYETQVVTATPTGADPWLASEIIPVVAGLPYLVTLETDGDDSHVVFYNDALTNLGQYTCVNGRWFGEAPQGATQARIRAMGPDGVPFRAWNGGVFQTDYALQTWQPPVHSEVVYNEAHNPDGAFLAESLDKVLFTNVAHDPENTNNASWNAYGGSTKAVITDTTKAWSGDTFERITTAVGSGLAAMYYPVLIKPNTGYTARFRVRGPAGKTMNTQISNYSGGSGTGGGAVSLNVTLTGTWQTVVTNTSTGHATADRLGIQMLRNNFAAGDLLEFDGMEIYEGSTLPSFYVAGSKPYPPRNLAQNPEMRQVAADGTVLNFNHNGNYTTGTQKFENGVPYMSIDHVAGSPTSWGVNTPVPAVDLRAGARYAVLWEVRGRIAGTEISPAQWVTGSGGNYLLRGYEPQVVGTEWQWVTSSGAPQVWDPATMNTLSAYLYSRGAWDTTKGLDVRRVAIIEVTDEAATIPLTYFNEISYTTKWSGAANASDSTLVSPATARTNFIPNPGLQKNSAGWSTQGAGTTFVRSEADVPGKTPSDEVPEVVNPAALDLWRTALAQAGTRSVGIGVVGDSCTESTGATDNTDLSDRYIERLQAALRRDTAVPDVPLTPEGYYGASTYIPVGYLHPGPADWVFETSDEVQYPISPLQSGFGAGGRLRNLTEGVRAHFTATFDSFRLAYGLGGFGRSFRITVDGVEQDVVDTYGNPAVTAYWDSPSYGHGEHTVVCEFVQRDGFEGGGATLIGADIYDGDIDKGVRVYDLSASGKAARDLATRPREMDDDFLPRQLDALIITLGFNDFGRTADWGDTITAAEFKVDIQTIIAGARTRGVSGPVLLVGQWHAPQLVPGVAGETQENFRAQLKAIAETDPTVAFVDLSTVMPDTDYAPWGQDSYYVDGLHPSTKGHERIADSLYGALKADAVEPTDAALLVSSTGGTGKGVRAFVTIDATHGPAWAVGQTYAAGAYVKAPLGAPMRLQATTGGSGNPGSTTSFVGTGKWEWVATASATVNAGTTTAPYVFVLSDSTTAHEFRVTKAILTSIRPTPYFDGASQSAGIDRYTWTGAEYASTSIERASGPVGWRPFNPTATVGFDPNTYVQGDGSVLVTEVAKGAHGQVVYDLPVPISAGKHVTILAAVKADFDLNYGTTIVAQNASGATLAQASYVDYEVDGWYEPSLRFETVSEVASIRIAGATVGYTPPAGRKMWVSELTVVVDDYFWNGTPFHGGQAGQNVDTAWEGEAHNSRTVGTFYNSSSVRNANQMGALFHPAAAGGTASEYVWVTSAFKGLGNRAFVICNGMRSRALRDGGGWNFQRNGKIYIAEFDLTTSTLVRWEHWFDDVEVQWGEASLIEGDYAYIYGANGSNTYVMRVDAADPIGSVREKWTTGNGWFDATNVQSVATTADHGGFTGVRLFDGQWIAMHVSGFMDHIDGYTAPAPQGPWTRIGSVMDFAQGPEYSNKYVARFHPQMDSDEFGIAIGYSESGQNGNEVYGNKFARGPVGTPIALFGPGDDASWIRHPSVETSPDSQGWQIPGWSYQARVRSRDDDDRVSPWVEGEAIVLNGDIQPPPKPAKPIAVSFFRGARIEVSGLTESGAAYPPDFQRLTIHQSTTEDFVPTDANLIDALVTKGGVVIASDLEWGRAYFWKVVAWDSTGNASEPSDPATAQSERLSDADLPEKLIDGAKHIKDESLSVKNFSVGAFGNTIVPNGTVEEYEPGAELPVGWEKGWPSGTYDDWDTAGLFATDSSAPISGSRSIRMTTMVESSRQLISKPFPVTPGDIYYVKAKIRTDRKLGTALVQVGLEMGATLTTVNGFGTEQSVRATAVVSDGGVGAVTVEGQVEVPDYRADGTGEAMRFAAFSVRAQHNGDYQYETWIDDVEVRQIVGSAAIADASINRAKIRYLAVDDARISSLSVGKLVAGELWADITVSSRIMTAKTGQRVEMNRDGLFGFNGTDTAPVTEVRADDGGLVSRWFRTNTTGTRIEMGTYGQEMGANAALMAFFPEGGQTWQFPPALGFGGDFRQGSIPGIGIHAGSHSGPEYDLYGMNMMGVDQVGGVTLVTGNLLNSSEAEIGAPIVINAGGPQGIVDISSGGRFEGTNYARLRLSGVSTESMLSLHRGVLNFGGEYVDLENQYSMQYKWATEWAGFPFNHIHMITGSGGGFRISDTNTSDLLQHRLGQLWVSDRFEGPAFNKAAMMKTQGTDSHKATIYYDGTSIGIIVYNSAGTQVASGTL